MMLVNIHDIHDIHDICFRLNTYRQVKILTIEQTKAQQSVALYASATNANSLLSVLKYGMT